MQGLEALLAAVRRPGDFFAEANFETAMPRVEIDGVGILSFPVPAAQIGQLIQAASRAPFGRGVKTVLDESVRKVWQLPPEKVRLGGKSWPKTFSRILDEVADSLGCSGIKISAELYKLLVYEEGGFFKAHRDTEKVAGMFGTLIVVLPSAHTGGELVIRHAGREVTLDLTSAEVSDLRVAAFYADCEHEVRPVTAGHRICLVYNLIQLPGKTRGGHPLSAPSNHAEIERAAVMLRDAFARKDAPAKLAWLFKHEYSAAGLSFAGLKGEDVVLAKALRQAAQAADCAVHLGIVHIKETGAAEPGYRDYYGGWGSDDDDGDEDFEVIEVFDSRCHIGGWHDTEDRPVDFGELPLAEGEVLPAGALDNEKPDEQRITEVTGNEGASFERLYRRAALVLWPRERFADVLLQAGVGAILPYLAERVEACADADCPAAQRKSVIALGRRVVKKWEQLEADDSFHYPEEAFDGRKGEGEGKRDEMLAVLTRLGDVKLLDHFASGVVTRQFDGRENRALAAAAALLGAQTSLALLVGLALEQLSAHPCEVVQLLGSIMDKLGERLDAPWQKTLASMATVVVAAVPTLKPPVVAPAGGAAARYGWGRFVAQTKSAGGEEDDEEEHEGGDGDGDEDELSREARAVDAAFVVQLLESLRILGAQELRAEAAAAIAANTAVFDPVTVVVPALTELNSTRGEQSAVQDDVKALWHHAAEFLLARSERAPVEPVDWKQEANFECKSEDDRQLQAFARNPVARERRFRANTEERRHLHTMIERHGLDMTHVTERKGRPYTLVCVKTRRAYERARAQHHADLKAMGALRELPQGTAAGEAKLSARMEIAAGK